LLQAKGGTPWPETKEAGNFRCLPNNKQSQRHFQFAAEVYVEANHVSNMLEMALLLQFDTLQWIVVVEAHIITINSLDPPTLT
jgi:hypothetical protein